MLTSTSGGGGRFFACFYLGGLSLIFLLGVLHGLQVVSGTIIVDQLPAPLGNSLLVQGDEKGYRRDSLSRMCNRIPSKETRFFDFTTELCNLYYDLKFATNPL